MRRLASGYRELSKATYYDAKSVCSSAHVMYQSESSSSPELWKLWSTATLWSGGVRSSGRISKAAQESPPDDEKRTLPELLMTTFWLFSAETSSP